MTKSEFLSTLADGLKELPDRKLAEIIFDYQENFTTGFSNGKTEKEIIEDSEYSLSKVPKQMKTQGILAAMVVLVVVIVFVLLGQYK